MMSVLRQRDGAQLAKILKAHLADKEEVVITLLEKPLCAATGPLLVSSEAAENLAGAPDGKAETFIPAK